MARVLCASVVYSLFSQREATLQRMRRPARSELAGVEIKRFDAKWRRRRLPMRVKPVRNRRGGIFRAAGERHVRMKGPHVQRHARRQDGVVNALPELKQ